jgi:hypothetical protein
MWPLWQQPKPKKKPLPTHDMRQTSKKAQSTRKPSHLAHKGKTTLPFDALPHNLTSPFFLEPHSPTAKDRRRSRQYKTIQQSPPFFLLSTNQPTNQLSIHQPIHQLPQQPTHDTSTTQQPNTQQTPNESRKKKHPPAMAINIGSFVGGIATGIATTLLILTCYYAIQRWVRMPRGSSVAAIAASHHSSRAHSRDLELGNGGASGRGSPHSTYMSQQPPYPGALHPAHFSGGRG